MTAAVAAAQAEEYAHWIAQSSNNILDLPQTPGAGRLWVDGCVDLAVNPDKVTGVPTWVDDQVAAAGDVTYRNVQWAAGDMATVSLWRKYKIVYDLDPALVEELERTNLDGAIPAEAVMHLPHPDPYVAFAEPIILPVQGGITQRVRGFFVTGRRLTRMDFVVGASEDVDLSRFLPGELAIPGYVQCSTHSGRADALGLMFVSDVHDPGGRRRYIAPGEPDMIFTRVSILPGQSVESMIAQVKRSFTPDAGVEVNWENDVDRLIRTAVKVVAYLSAENAEIDHVRGPGRKAIAKAVKARKVPDVHQVGYRLGSAIRKTRRVRHVEPAPAGGTGTGRVMPPHIRAAHFQYFRVGPGRPNQRTEKRLRWVNYIPVNMTPADSPAKVTTIRKVTK